MRCCNFLVLVCCYAMAGFPPGAPYMAGLGAMPTAAMTPQQLIAAAQQLPQQQQHLTAQLQQFQRASPRPNAGMAGQRVVDAEWWTACSAPGLSACTCRQGRQRRRLQDRRQHLPQDRRQDWQQASSRVSSRAISRASSRASRRASRRPSRRAR